MGFIMLKYGEIEGIKNVWQTSMYPVECIVNALCPTNEILVSCGESMPFVALNQANFQNYTLKAFDTVVLDKFSSNIIVEPNSSDQILMKKLFYDCHIPLDVQLPLHGNSFRLYAHDNGFYTCFLVPKFSNEEICQKLLSQLFLKQYGVLLSPKHTDTVLKFLGLVTGGIAIDKNKSVVDENRVTLAIHCFHDVDGPFSNLLYPKKEFPCVEYMSF